MKMIRRKNANIPREDLNDLGFGNKVIQQTHLRLLNHDGSFNVERTGLPFLRSISPFHSLLTMSWWKFHLTILTIYLVINAFFGLIYLVIGVEELTGGNVDTILQKFFKAFFFSVQTFTTVGYGQISPQGFLANMVATIDAFIGLMTFALATGLLFARFSKPVAKIIFSKNALIAPYRDIKAFEFRISNGRRSQLIEVEVKVLFVRFEMVNCRKIRRFYPLKLERSKVAFLPLHLTVVHPIDELSPMNGFTPDDLEAGLAEFLILITAIDETFSQTVHARSSYRYDEVIWNARYSDMFQYPESGIISVNLHRLHEYEEVKK